jgi:homoserine dehydrogenase
MGGLYYANDYVSRALRAGKSVVTSNKELIAEKGLELLNIAKEKDVSLLFEASVGGGIPIIRPLAQCLAANRIEEVYGILNGTTNYILTQMLQCGEDFDSALKDAQRLGYAEANPSADVDGIDTARKICILADMCFGRNVAPSLVKPKGIRSVTANDAALASRMGYSIKLLGRALRVGEERLAVYVAPHLVSKKKLISGIDGVMNGIFVRGNAVGECMFYGAGAGKLPTASAAVADIIDAVRREDEKKYISWDRSIMQMLVDPYEMNRRWFVRSEDGTGLCHVFDYVVSAEGGHHAIITDPMPLSKVKDMTRKLDITAIYPVLD